MKELVQFPSVPIPVMNLEVLWYFAKVSFSSGGFGVSHRPNWAVTWLSTELATIRSTIFFFTVSVFSTITRRSASGR